MTNASTQQSGRRLTLGGLLAIIGLLLIVFLFCAGSGPFEVGASLVIGWFRYLTRTLPKVRIDWLSMGSALLWVGLFAIGLHSFCGWLYRSCKKDDSAAGLPSRRWRTRWTAMLVGLVAFLFSAGTAAVCVAHQIGFLATAQEPMFAFYEYGAVRNTTQLKEYLAMHIGPQRQGSGLFSELWDDAIQWNFRHQKPFIDRHHLIAWSDGDGKVAGAIAFHRDPVLRAEHGIVIVTRERTVVRSADELSEVLKLVPSSAPIAATVPATPSTNQSNRN